MLAVSEGENVPCANVEFDFGAGLVEVISCVRDWCRLVVAQDIFNEAAYELVISVYILGSARVCCRRAVCIVLVLG